MKKLTTFLFVLGTLFLLSGIILFGFIFQPVIQQEYTYATSKHSNKQEIQPVDKEFGIVIPKIGANAKIIPAVDPYNSNEYQWALTKGVAQAKGTANPDMEGNMFLFSHSSANLLEAKNYNSVFYLLDKLEKGDKVEIYYRDTKYVYSVTGKQIVNADAVSYLTQKTTEHTLTLMTCWPAGTSFKRLIVNTTIDNK